MGAVLGILFLIPIVLGVVGLLVGSILSITTYSKIAVIKKLLLVFSTTLAGIGLGFLILLIVAETTK